MFVAEKEHSDFWAVSSIFHDVLKLITASSHYCSMDVALSMFVSCVHTATLLVKWLTSGTPSADAKSST